MQIEKRWNCIHGEGLLLNGRYTSPWRHLYVFIRKDPRNWYVFIRKNSSGDAVVTLIAAGLSAFASVANCVFSGLLNRKSEKIKYSLELTHIEIDNNNNRINERFSQLNTELKRVEVDQTARFNFSNLILQRHQQLQKALAEFQAYLFTYHDMELRADKKVMLRVNHLKSIISLYLTPKGEFAEEFNIEMSHILAFFETGRTYWARFGGYTNFIVAFNLNCWTLIDEDYKRIIDLLETGVEFRPSERKPQRPPLRMVR